MTVRDSLEVTNSPVGGVRSLNDFHYFHGWMFSNLETHEENHSFACAGQVVLSSFLCKLLVVCCKGLQSLLGVYHHLPPVQWPKKAPEKSTGFHYF